MNNLKCLVVSGSGDGKTHFSATFPKSYFLITEPGGEHTWTVKPNLKKNVVGHKIFIPESADDTKRVFKELAETLKEVKEKGKTGEVETLILDNITYLSENRWIYINKHEPSYSRSGELNTQAMYGDLSRWLYQFVLMGLLTFPGNVVVTCHIMLESDEALEKKPDQSTPILPNILGGFRDKIEGMFSLVLYLNKKLDAKSQTFKFMGQTNRGNQRNAKNRYNLPPLVEDISYAKIMDAIDKSIKGGEGK
jgi:hypothetical protein